MRSIVRLWWLYVVALRSRQALLSGGLVAITIIGTTLVASGGRRPMIAFGARQDALPDGLAWVRRRWDGMDWTRYRPVRPLASGMRP